MTTHATPNQPLPGGTRVLNTNDGEPGSILNGYGWDTRTGEWNEYEVETQYAKEIWKRNEFVLLDEIEAEANAD